MTWQQNTKEKSKQGKLYHYMDYKKKRPFFTQPMKITINDHAKHTYYMINNIVYGDKQILALRNEEDPGTIILVEAIIEDGQLIYISMLPEQVLSDVSKMFEDII